MCKRVLPVHHGEPLRHYAYDKARATLLRIDIIQNLHKTKTKNVAVLEILILCTFHIPLQHCHHCHQRHPQIRNQGDNHGEVSQEDGETTALCEAKVTKVTLVTFFPGIWKRVRGCRTAWPGGRLAHRSRRQHDGRHDPGDAW